MFKVVDPKSSIYVELTNNGVVQIAEFPPGEERAFVVGSIEWAHLRVSGVDVAPVQFHLEREGAAICLVPAYGIADLSVNAISVVGPTPLAQRSVIEFCGVRVYAAIREADSLSSEDDRFVARDTNAHLDHESYSLRLPGEFDLTVVAMHPVGPSPPPVYELPTVTRTGVPNEVQDLPPLDNTTLRLPPFRAAPPLLDEHRPILTSSGTEVMAPYRSPASAAMATEDTSGLARPQAQDPHPELQHSPKAPTWRPHNAPTWETNTPNLRGSVTTLPDGQAPEYAVSGRKDPLDNDPVVLPMLPVIPLVMPTGLLSAIGVLTRARPLLVLGGASIGALVLVLTLLGAARLIERHQAAPALQSTLDTLSGAAPPAQPEAKVHNQEQADVQPTR